MVVFEMRDSLPSARYSPVCNVLRQWKTSLILTYRVYRLYNNFIVMRNYYINVVQFLYYTANIQFNRTSYTVLENTHSVSNICLQLSSPSNSDTSFTLSTEETSPPTARGGLNYTEVSESLVFKAGEIKMCFNVSINTSTISSNTIQQFLLLLGYISNGVVPGRNVAITFTIRKQKQGLACTPESLPTLGNLTSIRAQDVKPSQINRQWIFPSLRFTCSLNVTGWMFRTASNQVEPNTKCPTIGLWRDNDITPSNTADYVRWINISEFRRPERITPFVFRCNLATPLLVHTGSILGFSSKVPASGDVMQVQFTEQASTVGYHRNVGLGILFNTVVTSIVDEASGVVPLVIPLDGSEEEGLTTSTPSPSTSASTMLPTSSSFPPVKKGREGSGTSSATAMLVAVPLCIVVLLVLAISALVFAAIFFRQRHALSITKQADGQSQGDLESSTAKQEKGLGVTTNHDYDEVDKMASDLSKKHDYDVVNPGTPLVWSPIVYEIPFTQTMGHGVSKQPVISTTVYETPRKCLDLYEVPTAARGILRGGTQVADRGYDTPIDAQNGTHRTNNANYETMWVDSHSSQPGNWSSEEGFQDGPAESGQPNPAPAQDNCTQHTT